MARGPLFALCKTLARAASSEGLEEKAGRKLRFLRTAPPPRHTHTHSSVLCSLRLGCGLLSRRLRGVGDREAGPGRPRGPERREAAPRARTAATRVVPGSPGGMTASHPGAWEPQAIRRSQELGLEVSEGSVLPRRASPKRSAGRPEPGSCRAPHSPPGGAGTRRARPLPQRNELSTAALGAARGHSGEASGLGEEKGRMMG